MSTPEAIRVFIGYDSREASAFHVCVQSIIEHSSRPVEIHPLALNNMESFYTERHVDGSNAFIYSRFLVPYLCGWQGWAIYLDGDMLLRCDIAELWAQRQVNHGVSVVQHEYKTRYPVKYLGAQNPDYERKNWSSVMLWNCGYYPNRKLTPEFVTQATGEYLHRFEWLKDEQIEPLSVDWNWLTMEYHENPGAKLLHYTVGLPAFKGYDEQEGAREWFDTCDRMLTPLV
jgi:lipopolysaccharide biosynthesis glycosyltransferase